MSSTYKQIGERVGALVDEKNAAYGDSFGRSDAFLKLLYPYGIPTAQMHHALVLGRIFDKLSRIATDPDALGESPYIDIAGYALLGAHMHEESKKRCGSASETGAVEESKEQSDFVGLSVPRPITTNAEPQTEPILQQLWNVQHFNCSCAPAVHVAEPGSRTEGAALAARVRNRNQAYNQCGICTNPKQGWRSSAYAGEFFYFCSRACRVSFHRLLQGKPA